MSTAKFIQSFLYGNGIGIENAFPNEYSTIQYTTTNANPGPVNRDPATSDPHLTLTTEDKMNLKNILEYWNMGYLYQACLNEYIGVEQLSCIDSYKISTFLNKYKYPLGVQVIFEQCIKQWRKKRNEIMAENLQYLPGFDV